jgi:hypothetical protein
MGRRGCGVRRAQFNWTHFNDQALSQSLRLENTTKERRYQTFDLATIIVIQTALRVINSKASFLRRFFCTTLRNNNSQFLSHGS